MTEQEHGQTSAAPPGGSPHGNKPVVVYIMVLFIAAFLLMALSFLMHQRSNSEVMGALQSSVSAMQELQVSQERIETLEKELEEAKAAADAFQDANETSRNQAAHMEHLLEQTQTALDWFWQLNEAYLQEDLVRCRALLDGMYVNGSPLSDYLPPNSAAAERYQEILRTLDALEDAEAGAS